MTEPLDALLASPSQEALASFLTACFRFRGRPGDLVSCRAVAGLGFEHEQARSVSLAMSAIVSSVLYNSADIASEEAVLPFIPTGVDSRLRQLLCSVSLNVCVVTFAPAHVSTPPFAAHFCGPPYMARGSNRITRRPSAS